MANTMPVVRAGEVTSSEEASTEEEDTGGIGHPEEDDDSALKQLEAVFSVDPVRADEQDEPGADATVQVPETLTAMVNNRLQLTLYRPECLKCGNLLPQLGEKYYSLDVSCSIENGNNLCPAGWFTFVVQGRKRRKVSKILSSMATMESIEAKLDALTRITQLLQGEEEGFVQETLEQTRSYL